MGILRPPRTGLQVQVLLLIAFSKKVSVPMSKSKLTLPNAVLSAAIASGLFLTPGLQQPVRASDTLENDAALQNRLLLSVQFNAPGDAAPQTGLGGGVRGSVQFSLPGGATPSTSIGGGTRGSVQFSLPGGATPSTSIGGGTRGSVQFSLPGGATPSTSLGGGTRGTVFSYPGDSSPPDTAGGGSRGEIWFETQTPEELIPVTEVGMQGQGTPMRAVLPPSQYGQTVSARPTFFVYMPQTLSQEVFFSVQDEQGKTLYHTRLNMSGQGGVVSVTLPDNAPELEIGKNYLWFFAPIQPGEILRPDNAATVGWVKRVEAASDRESFSSAIEQASAYAKEGIWYDTLSVLAQAQRSQPDNAALVQEWKELLEQVGLEAIATQPIAEQL
jgi:Domain of Unknown Function (DUF928)